MDSNLRRDLENLDELLDQVHGIATEYLSQLNNRDVAPKRGQHGLTELNGAGLGAKVAIEEFMRRFGGELSASSGPRYFGFVTGGSTPAALAADWLVSAFDQNAADLPTSCTHVIEKQAVDFVRQLVGLPNSFSGSLTTGATMANFVGLALGREWILRQRGINASESGVYATKPIKILAGCPHSTIFKALSMAAMGRQHLDVVDCLKDRECIDTNKLEERLRQLEGEPAIVSASAGTVNTVDFDDFKKLADLKAKYGFWLHVDAAFGAFAACSPKFKHLVEGMECADSVTIDAHKWLNVPYDCGIQLSRHRDLQIDIFQNYAPYLGPIDKENPGFIHLAPEGSRRFRALPLWISLLAYGKNGFQEIVERHCQLAQEFAEKVEASSTLELLSKPMMHIVCFTLKGDPTMDEITTFLQKARSTGKIFLTPTLYRDKPAMRLAISNWRTQEADIAMAFRTLEI